MSSGHENLQKRTASLEMLLLAWRRIC